MYTGGNKVRRSAGVSNTPLAVCSLTYLRNRMAEVRQIFCALPIVINIALSLRHWL